MRNRILLASALASAMAATSAGAQRLPGYGAATQTVFIPFVNVQPGGVAFTDPVQLSFSLGGRTHRVIMDTGSTGVMIASSLIPGYQPLPTDSAGWEFLSSSKLLFKGHWVPQDLVFLDVSGTPLATARVPVLAVDSVITCRNFDMSTGTCPDPTQAQRDTSTLYLGVGFGREHNGQTQGTPGRNPFLSLTRIGNVPVQSSSFRPGYVITKTGVHLGLTAVNAESFVAEQLQPGSNGALDWQQAPICLRVNDSPCVTGSALVDTGIPQMYLTVTPQIPVDTVPELDPSTGDTVGVLVNSTRVTVLFPGTDPVAYYTFTVGDTANPMAPTLAIPSIQDTTATFVNTGRHFLRNFDVLFDAQGGVFGLRWTGPTPSPYGGANLVVPSSGGGRR